MDKDIEKAKSILRNYLKENKLRETIERLYILEVIYSLNKNFSIEELREAVGTSKIYISRATLYNTMQLFLDSRLIVKLPLVGNVTRYEKTLTVKPTNKIICISCGKENYFKDKDITKALNEKQYKKYKLVSHNVFLYGVCYKCQQKDNRKTIQKVNKSN